MVEDLLRPKRSCTHLQYSSCRVSNQGNRSCTHLQLIQGFQPRHNPACLWSPQCMAPILNLFYREQFMEDKCIHIETVSTRPSIKTIQVEYLESSLQHDLFLNYITYKVTMASATYRSAYKLIKASHAVSHVSILRKRIMSYRSLTICIPSAIKTRWTTILPIWSH